MSMYEQILAELREMENAWPQHDYQAQANEVMARSPLENAQQMTRDYRATNASHPKNEGHPRTRAAKSRRTQQRVKSFSAHNPDRVKEIDMRIAHLIKNNQRADYINAHRQRFTDVTFYFNRPLHMIEVHAHNRGKMRMVGAFVTKTVDYRFENDRAVIVQRES